MARSAPTTPAQTKSANPDRQVKTEAAKRFQRVKEDDVAIKDHRLMSNRYDDKGGETFGSKAWQDLKQVRGKDFRREKTKKKRNTFFGGGRIESAGVNSVKFESDGE